MDALKLGLRHFWFTAVFVFRAVSILWRGRSRAHIWKWFYGKRKGSIKMSINRKIAVVGQQRRGVSVTLVDCDAKARGFDAALRFDFMHFLMSISGRGGVVVIE